MACGGGERTGSAVGGFSVRASMAFLRRRVIGGSEDEAWPGDSNLFRFKSIEGGVGFC